MRDGEGRDDGMGTPAIVTEVEKLRIAPYATFLRNAMASPFGSKDEIGMLNLIDTQSRAAIVSRAVAAKVFDLSVDYFVDMSSVDKAADPSDQIYGELPRLASERPRNEENQKEEL
jgi:hypothetical protein